MPLAGFVALAPGALSAAGGTPTDEAQMRELFGKLDPAPTRYNEAAAKLALERTITFLKAKLV